MKPRPGRFVPGLLTVSALVLAAVASVTVFAAPAIEEQQQPAAKEADAVRDRRFLESKTDLFLDVVDLVRAEYVDEVPIDSLFAGALNGMLRSLDPYSQYLDEAAYRELKADTEGEFGGLGLEVSVKGGFLHVISPLDDTPAARAGLLAGDTIVKIDGETTREITLAEAVKRMRGVPGTVIRLTVMREGESQLREIPVTRDRIVVRSIKESKLLEGGVGYVRISAFQENSAADLEKALDSLDAQGMKGLILDVRNNSGGLLSAAKEVAELFVPEGKLIVSTRGRGGKKEVLFVSKNPSPRRISPLVLVADRGSASGSEILAGALQDHKLAVVVGEKTFGKVSVQTLVPLPDGGAVRLTTSKYYTPNGRLLHEVGITPDFPVQGQETASAKDPALERALEIARGPLKS